jgi:para-nitrobenzyl esterase
MPEWHGSGIAHRGVTMVSFNYRLGVFGFLDHPETGGNFAVQDWVAALTLVSRNIATFGGDPDNVTVFGHSAGATAGRTLLSTPTTQGLFRRAILQSAGLERAAALPDTAQDRLVETSAPDVRDAGRKRYRTPAAGAHRAGTASILRAVRHPADPRPGAHPRQPDLVSDQRRKRCGPRPVLLAGRSAGAVRAHHGRGAVLRQTERSLRSPPGIDPNLIYTPATLTAMAKALGATRAEDVSSAT